MKDEGKILTAFIAGAAIGAVLGVLFAPEKGTETRRKMQEEGQKWAETMEGKFKEGKEKFQSMKEKMQQMANGGMETDA